MPFRKCGARVSCQQVQSHFWWPALTGYKKCCQPLLMANHQPLGTKLTTLAGTKGILCYSRLSCPSAEWTVTYESRHRKVWKDARKSDICSICYLGGLNSHSQGIQYLKDVVQKGDSSLLVSCSLSSSCSPDCECTPLWWKLVYRSRWNRTTDFCWQPSILIVQFKSWHIILTLLFQKKCIPWMHHTTLMLFCGTAFVAHIFVVLWHTLKHIVLLWDMRFRTLKTILLLGWVIALPWLVQ